MIDKKIGLITLLIIAVVIVVAVWNESSRTKVRKPQNGQTTALIKSSEVGQKASDFELESFDGEKVKLSEFGGKPVFIDFWAAWCPFCVEEMVEIEKVHKNLGDKVVILGIHRSETESVDKGAEFAKKRGVTYPLLKDTTGAVYKTFTEGRNFMPYAIYIDKDGVIKQTKAGPKTADEIKKNAEELLK